MDFVERLSGHVNSIPGQTATCKLGYLGTDESFVLYSLPGSKTVTEYMDGTKDQQLNYEFAMKSKVQSKILNTLWLVQNNLDDLKELASDDNSFKFDEITITNKPFINQIDNQGWFVFLLNVTANITVLKEEK